jgi:hypothetical protein
MLAGAGVVLALLINNVSEFQNATAEARYLFFGALFALAAALIAGVVALWPRRVKVVPSPRGLVEGYYARDHDDTLASLVSTRLHAAELNKNLSVGKWWALRFQMVLVAIGAIGLVFAFLVKE